MVCGKDNCPYTGGRWDAEDDCCERRCTSGHPCREGEGSLYDHQMTLLDGSRNVSLSEYSGKVVMLVNVATY